VSTSVKTQSYKMAFQKQNSHLLSHSVAVTPSEVIGACTPTKAGKLSEIEVVGVSDRIPLLKSPTNNDISGKQNTQQLSACAELTPFPLELLKRVKGWTNVKNESTDAGSTKCHTKLMLPRHEDGGGVCRSPVQRRSGEALPVAEAGSTIREEENIADESAFKCDGFPIEYESFRKKVIGEISRLVKMVAEIRSSQQSSTAKYQNRISELEKRNKELEREMSFCSSHIKVISERKPQFRKQNSGSFIKNAGENGSYQCTQSHHFPRVMANTSKD